MSRGNHYKRKRRGPDKRIDYAFVRRGRSVEVRPQSCELLFQTPMDLGRRVRPISDHYGLACEIEVGPGSGALTSLVPADPEAVDLAHRLLSEGRAELSRSESGHFKAAGSWLAGAAAAMVIRRNDRVSRRRFMHRALGFAAIAALAPAAGFTALAHLDVSKKLRAFDAAAASLGGMVSEHAPRPIRAARAEGTPDAGGASRPL